MIRRHPFAYHWNHNAHYYPELAVRIPAEARLVVDVGCGDATLANFLARPGRRVLGLDIDIRNPPRCRPGVYVVAASATALPLPDASVDALTMVMVLHHVNAQSALAEVRRVLRPRGVCGVLGYGRTRTVGDLAADLRDAAVHRAHALVTKRWQPDVAVADPSHTWAENRQLLGAELPGGTYQRVPMWRFLYTWTAPG